MRLRRLIVGILIIILFLSYLNLGEAKYLNEESDTIPPHDVKKIEKRIL